MRPKRVGHGGFPRGPDPLSSPGPTQLRKPPISLPAPSARVARPARSFLLPCSTPGPSLSISRISLSSTFSLHQIARLLSLSLSPANSLREIHHNSSLSAPFSPLQFYLPVRPRRWPGIGVWIGESAVPPIRSRALIEVGGGGRGVSALRQWPGIRYFRRRWDPLWMDGDLGFAGIGSGPGQF